jgi:hypothetical protein
MSGGSDSGSGSALSSITSAALSIGSASVSNLLNTPTQVNAPQTTIPPYSVATAVGTSSSTMIVILGVLAVIVFGVFFAIKK